MQKDGGNQDPLEGRFDNLGMGGRLVGTAAAHARIPVMAMVLATSLIGWWFLAVMAGSAARTLPEAGGLGPGMSLVARFLPVDGSSYAARLADLCLTAADGALFDSVPGATRIAALAAMWAAMAVAMMLPTAAPMIRTYAEIADTAAARGRAVVHPAVLAGGYLSAWALAALGFAAFQSGLAAVSGSGALAPARGFVAGAILILAGAYQFSRFKQACLEKCRNPFTTLFARWRHTAHGVWKLGFEQGLWCLGCCWALMLVMLAAGAMNVVWMAALTLFTFIEKTGSGRVTSRIGGTIVTAWGVALIVSASWQWQGW